MVVDRIRRAGAMLSGFNLADIIALMGDLAAMRNSIARFQVCLDGDKIVFIGDVEGEIEIKNPDIVVRIRRWLQPCRK